MQTRNGLTYCGNFSNVEQNPESSNFAPPINFLQKVEQKKEVLGLAPSFSKVDFDEASAAWKLNKKSIGNGCYKYICVKVKKNGHQCKNDSLKNCEHCKFHSTFRKG